MKQSPHLTAGITSLVVLALALIGFNFYAQTLEQRYVNALAPLSLPETINGIALQHAALQQADLLPLYGSSELTLLDTQYEANNFFAKYPTGFTVFKVANLGASSLTMAQDLATLGPDLRGKKIVVTLSPANFIINMNPAPFYKENYSRLHAYGMIFSPYLSLNIKSEAARSMLLHPDTLQDDPFLDFTLNQIATPSMRSQLLYDLLWPLGKLQTEILRLQDHAAVVSIILSRSIAPNIPHTPATLDWASIHARALAEQKQHTLNNPFGIEDSKWWYYSYLKTDPIHPGSRDKKFIYRVMNHPEWGDFKILMEVLQAYGAKPLILTTPMNVRVWEALGVSEQAQNTYYTKLQDVIAPYGAQVMDFRQYGTYIYFSIDHGSHASRAGWVYIDQALNDFYHGQLRRAP